MSKKEHWDNIYSTKTLQEVSWHQPIPETSLDFILSLGLPKDSPIIDVGGGDSFLVDFLINEGYTDLTVLDISKVAIERAKIRLAKNANKINWIVSDITNFSPKRKYSVWHDRAVFHFLRKEQEIKSYLESLSKGTAADGRLVLGTFAENGPIRCCALDVKRYSFNDLEKKIGDKFLVEKMINSIHQTPFKTEQSFNFVQAIKK
jgi:2-polyprenyl-3-methyl-5-hydroxy-6-metoxy-1,4-benzoquinol methylase